MYSIQTDRPLALFTCKRLWQTENLLLPDDLGLNLQFGMYHSLWTLFMKIQKGPHGSMSTCSEQLHTQLYMLSSFPMALSCGKRAVA